MDSKLVSIIIPTYNNETYVQEAISAALAQTYKNIEVVVVDNKSTDNSWDVLQSIAAKEDRVKVFQNEENVGPVKNWIVATNKATGYYGKILWSDDLIAPDFIEKTIPLLEDESVGFVFTGAEVFCDEGGKRSKRDNYFIGKDTGSYSMKLFMDDALFGYKYPNSPGNAIFRLKDLKNNILENIPNHFNEDFSVHSIGIDRSIFMLTALDYSKFGYVNKKLSFFRDHASGITSSSSKERLALLHGVARAVFVENNMSNKMIALNATLQKLLEEFPNNKYGIEKLTDFYYNTKELNLGFAFKWEVFKLNLRETQFGYYLSKLNLLR